MQMRSFRQLSHAAPATVRFVILSFGLALLFVPVFWMLLSSVKSNQEYMAYPIQILPERPRWENYLGILSYTPFLETILRTFSLGMSTAAITSLTSALVGYGFARYAIPGSKQLFLVVVSMMIVPYIVLLIPQFILYAQLKLTNSYWPWYLTALSGSPFYIFLYRQFFLGFPKEIEEAAELDGANPLRTFFGIILPNSQAAITLVIIFAFNATWGDFIWPTLFLTRPDKLLGALMVPGRISTDYMAASVIYLIPVTILFILIQKHIQQGVFIGGWNR